MNIWGFGGGGFGIYRFFLRLAILRFCHFASRLSTSDLGTAIICFPRSVKRSCGLLSSASDALRIQSFFRLPRRRSGAARLVCSTFQHVRADERLVRQAFADNGRSRVREPLGVRHLTVVKPKAFF